MAITSLNIFPSSFPPRGNRLRLPARGDHSCDHEAQAALLAEVIKAGNGNALEINHKNPSPTVRAEKNASGSTKHPIRSATPEMLDMTALYAGHRGLSAAPTFSTVRPAAACSGRSEIQQGVCE